MQNVILSINKNVLRISCIVDKNLLSDTVEISDDIVSNSKLIDCEKLSSVIGAKLAEFNINKRKGLVMTYVSEPRDVVTRFVTVSKDVEDIQGYIASDLQKKILDFDIETSFFSFEKIAPFVYQVLSARKDYIEKILELSNLLQIPLAGVYSWISLLPKYVGTNDPAIFISKLQDEQVVALSELGGIFYSGVYDEEMQASELNKIISELSAFNRSKPINKIYTINYGAFALGNYDINPIDIPGSEGPEDEFDVNLLVNYMLDFVPNLDAEQANILNMLPLPQVDSSSKSIIKSTTVIGGIVVAGLFFGGFLIFRNIKMSVSKNQLAENTATQESVVLSESNTKESTPSAQENKTGEEVKVDKSSYTLRVENASGINGIAGKTQTLLNEAGYNVTEIDTADTNRESTIIRHKPSVAGVIGGLKADMASKYPQIETEDTLSEESEYDILIIVGASVDL